MSSIQDLLQQEREAEAVLKAAEQQAETILRDAKVKAGELARKAQSDDALVKELTERNKERILATRAKIESECQAKAEDTERLCRRNLDAAVKLILDSVVGVASER